MHPYHPVALSDRFWSAIRYPRRQLLAAAVLVFVDYEAILRAGSNNLTIRVIAAVIVLGTSAALLPLARWWVFIISAAVAGVFRRLGSWVQGLSEANPDLLALCQFFTGMLLAGIVLIWLSWRSHSTALFWAGLAMVILPLYWAVSSLCGLRPRKLAKD
jgi:sterol desaturase/sphingolipid hydroxylase (fatty acid hydroxylase superfamily)